MNTRTCPKCGAEALAAEYRCTACGVGLSVQPDVTPDPNEVAERQGRTCCWGCGLPVALLVIAILVAPLCAPEDSPRRSGITLAQYNRVTAGMTLAQVERILGKGALLDDARMSPGVIYGWDGEEPGADAIIGFEGGRVVARHQRGLR